MYVGRGFRAADSCCNTDGALHGQYSGAGEALTVDSGLPFTQLQLCFLTRFMGNLSVPYGSVSFYEPSTPACPGNWTPFLEANGRALLPGYDGVAPTPSDAPPLSSQEDRPHTHTGSTSVTTNSISYVGLVGWLVGWLVDCLECMCLCVFVHDGEKDQKLPTKGIHTNMHAFWKA